MITSFSNYVIQYSTPLCECVVYNVSSCSKELMEVLCLYEHIHIHGDEIDTWCCYSPWKFAPKSRFEVAWMSCPPLSCWRWMKVGASLGGYQSYDAYPTCLTSTNKITSISLFFCNFYFFIKVEISLLCLLELNSQLQKWLRLSWVPLKVHIKFTCNCIESRVQWICLYHV